VADQGLSGPAVAALAVGTLLAYAGFRGVSPLQALRDVSGGKPAGVENRTAGLTTGTATTGVADASSFGQAVAAAAAGYASDRYSQAPMRRTAVGWSDCSSFSAKSFIAAGAPGIKAWWTTMSFRTSPQFKTIPVASAQAGDILITTAMTLSGAHMAIVTAPGQAIGQQNSRSNVQSGSFATIMYGKPGYIAMRYVGEVPARYHGGSG
jgi:MFS family permease